MNKFQVLFCVILFLKSNSALEYNRQRLSTNTDFLLHESGVQTNGQKYSEAAGQQHNTNDNGGQIINTNNKRDFVNVTPKSTSTTLVNTPEKQLNPNPDNGKRDYVAPQVPHPKSPVQNTQQTTEKTTTTISINNKGSTNGKRDYVASKIPAFKPVPNNQPTDNTQGSSTKAKPTTTPDQPTKPTSYSSVVTGSTNGKRDYVASKIPTIKPFPSNQPTSNTLGSSTKATPTTGSIQPTKPMSYSSVVAGSKKGSTNGQTFTTAKPAKAPSTPVLPSSLVSNNRPTGINNLNTVTDAELQLLSEELLRKDTNNAARYITINYQEKTSSQSKDDKASQALLTVSPEAWNIPTVQKFIPLLDNYEKDAFVNEHVTPQERIEENNFMDAVMSTTVMRHLMNFLKNKGLVSLDPKLQRDFVKQLWFTLYSRGQGKLGSSGFEHTFLSEIKNGGVQGLHNWIYFSREEAANRVNYLGYMKYAVINDKGVVVKFHFNQQGLDKPVNAMFIGTSPELELALYTLCYVTRVDNDCNLKLGTKDVNIITYNYRYRSKNLVGTAYPQI